MEKLPGVCFVKEAYIGDTLTKGPAVLREVSAPSPQPQPPPPPPPLSLGAWALIYSLRRSSPAIRSLRPP